MPFLSMMAYNCGPDGDMSVHQSWKHSTRSLETDTSSMCFNTCCGILPLQAHHLNQLGIKRSSALSFANRPIGICRVHISMFFICRPYLEDAECSPQCPTSVQHWKCPRSLNAAVTDVGFSWSHVQVCNWQMPDRYISRHRNWNIHRFCSK